MLEVVDYGALVDLVRWAEVAHSAAVLVRCAGLGCGLEGKEKALRL